MFRYFYSTCMRGKWSCTEAICKAECLVFGDAHYETFDGKKYEFSGSCSYKLVVTDDVIVEIVNSVCNKCKVCITFMYEESKRKNDKII